jgi:hypothetical protein
VDLGTGKAEPAQAKMADLAGAELLTHVPPSVDQSGLGSYRITRWQGLAWLNGNKIVRAGEGSPPLVAIIDVDRAAVVRALAVPPGPVTVLGWLDDHTVLVQTSRGVLAWDIGSGDDWTVGVPPVALWGALVAAVLIGTLAGLDPAIRAARLAPAEALRSE